MASTEVPKDAIDRKEKQKSGSISFKAYKMILNAVDSTKFVAIVLVAFLVAQLAVSATDYFVSRWCV